MMEKKPFEPVYFAGAFEMAQRLIREMENDSGRTETGEGEEPEV